MTKVTVISLELAAQCWCDEDTSNIEMDPHLANAFAKRLDTKDKRIAELEKERDKIDPLLIELLKCCDGLSTEFGQSNYGSANEWVRHIDNAYVKYTDAVDDNTSEKLLQAHNLEQQAKGLIDYAEALYMNIKRGKYHQLMMAAGRLQIEAKALKEG